MAGTKRSYLRRKISRLEREIRSMDEIFYLTEKDGNPAQYAAMLECKRDDMIRAAVLQLHTSIESILTTSRLSRASSRNTGRSTRKCSSSIWIISMVKHGRFKPCRRGRGRERGFPFPQRPPPGFRLSAQRSDRWESATFL